MTQESCRMRLCLALIVLLGCEGFCTIVLPAAPQNESQLTEAECKTTIRSYIKDGIPFSAFVVGNNRVKFLEYVGEFEREVMDLGHMPSVRMMPSDTIQTFALKRAAMAGAGTAAGGYLSVVFANFAKACWYSMSVPYLALSPAGHAMLIGSGVLAAATSYARADCTFFEFRK